MLAFLPAVVESIGVPVGLQNLYAICSLSVINRPYRETICAVFVHVCSKQEAATCTLSRSIKAHMQRSITSAVLSLKRIIA